MANAMRFVIAISGLVLLALFEGCSEAGRVAGPSESESSAIVSDPTVLSRAAGGLSRTLSAYSELHSMVYVSLPPGAIPSAENVLIRHRRSGYSLTVLLVDGGFDPVLVPAAVGDTVEVITTKSGGEAVHLRLVVPARRPPRVVRTVPPRGKTDVSLNARMLVVFSEPIDPQTLAATSVQLLRGTERVPGQVEFVDSDYLTAAFVPEAPLAPATRYQLVVTQAIRDHDGEPLEAPMVAEFTTGSTTTNALEPNGSPNTASNVALNDVVSTALDPFNDKDYFAIELVQGTVIEFKVTTAFLGTSLPPLLDLLAPDGVTVLASNGELFDHGKNYLRYIAPASGRYFVHVRNHDSTTELPNRPYSIRFGTLEPGPGDPPTVFVADLAVVNMTAGPAGEIYAILGSTTSQPGSLLRIDVSGAISVVPLGGIFYPVDVVVDGFGHLLVTTDDHNFNGRVLRIAPDRSVSVFAQGGHPRTITVGPDGDVWIADADGVLRRFSPFGQLRDSFPLSGGAFVLAFSPAGYLHVLDANSHSVFRLDGGVLQRVIEETAQLPTGMAFDENGFLFVAAYEGVQLFDPQYRLIRARYMSDPQWSGSLIFGRSTTGAMSTRLLVSSGEERRIIEANPSRAGAPGHREGVDFVRFANGEVASGVLGERYADTLRMTDPPAAATWSLVAGALPPGLTLDVSTGVLSGVPAQAGTFEFTVRADAGGRFGLWPFRLAVERLTGAP
jgi:hypothetical protein